MTHISEDITHIKTFGTHWLESLHLNCKREPVDSSAVAVWREDEIFGHVPFNIASVLSQFLRRDCNQGFVEVTGEKINRGAGYGL